MHFNVYLLSISDPHIYIELQANIYRDTHTVMEPGFNSKEAKFL